MAKKDLQITIQSDPSSAVAAMAKTITQMEGVIAKLKEANKEARGFGGAFGDLSGKAGQVASQITSIAAGFVGGFTLTGAMQKFADTLKNEIEDLKRKDSEAGRLQGDYTKQFALLIGKRVGKEFIDKYYEQMRAVVKQSPLLTMETATPIISEYLRAQPGAKEKPEEVMKVLSLLGRTVGYEMPTELAFLVGKLEEAAPKKTKEQLVSTALVMRRALGEHAQDLPEMAKFWERLKLANVPFEEQMAITYAGLESEQGSRGLRSLTGIMMEERKGAGRKATKKRPFTDEELIKEEIHGMTDEQFWNWMLRNPEKVDKLYGKEAADILPTIAGERVKTGRALTAGALKVSELARQEAIPSKYMERAEAVRGMELAPTKMKEDLLESGLSGLTRENFEEYIKSIPELPAWRRKLLLQSVERSHLVEGLSYPDAAKEALHVELTRVPSPGYAPWWMPGQAPKYSDTSRKSMETFIGTIDKLAKTYNGEEMNNKQDNLINSINKLTDSLNILNNKAENTVPPVVPESE